MADFSHLKMTDKGRELQAKAQTGQPLKFLRVELGDGVAPDVVESMTALVSKRLDLSIQRKEVPGNGTAEMLVILTNQGLDAGFYMREMGVIAEDPDTLEAVLYSYTSAERPDFMPPYGGATVVEQIFKLVTVIGNAENVTAVIDDFITIALKSEVDAIKPRLMPEGGTVGQMVRKASNADGDVEYFSAEVDGFDVRLTSIEEPRTAVANQRVFTLQKTVTNGLAVYINGERLSRESWTALSATQLQLDDPLTAGTRVLFVNNEEAGPGRALNVSLTGPTLVYPASSNSFIITDFDSFSVYSAASTVGSVTRNGGELTLDIPADATEGTLDLEVTRDNVRATYRVAVGAAAIAAPEILSPMQGATNVTFEPDLAASAFVVYPAGYDSHAETRWQVARDTGFTDLVFDQQGADNLTAISLAAAGVRLDPSTRYYVRAQYHGATLVSAWSVAVAFNTTAVYVRRPAIISPTDGQENVSSRVFKGDAFSVYGGADTHAASRWQVSTVADFSTVLADSGWTTAELTSWTPTVSLAPASQFYIRVQYRGASAGDSGWSPVVSITTADPLQGIYTTRATGPAARSGMGVVSLGGYIYVCGGYNNGHRSDCWRYEPAANTWTQMASMPGARFEFGATAHAGKIYVAGGNVADDPDYDNTVYCYDPATNIWSTLQAMPLALRFPVLVSIGEYLYVLGGLLKVSVGADVSRQVHRFDPATNTWVESGFLSEEVMAGNNTPQGFAIGGLAYLLFPYGNATYPGGLVSYDPATNEWTAHQSPSTRQLWGALAVVSGLLYIHGGNGGTYPTSDYRVLQEYDPASNTWRALPIGGPKIYNHQAAELDGGMYFFGGTNPQASNAVVNWFYRID